MEMKTDEHHVSQVMKVNSTATLLTVGTLEIMCCGWHVTSVVFLPKPQPNDKKTWGKTQRRGIPQDTFSVTPQSQPGRQQEGKSEKLSQLQEV